MTCLKLVCFASLLILKVFSKEITFRNVTLEDVHKRREIVTIFQGSSISRYCLIFPTQDLAVIGRIPILHENSVTDIVNVQKLHFIRNEIEDIRPGAFKNFTSVETLHISYSNFTIIRRHTFNDLEIRELMIIFNRKLEIIEDGALDNSHIETLILNYNGLKELPKNIFQKMPKLRNLHVSANFLTTLHPEFITPNLVSAYFAFNRLTKVPNGIFANHQTLQDVDVSKNKITSIESEAFDDMPHLKNVSLENNKLTKIDSRWFHNTPQIQRLFLIRNAIEEIPEGAFKNVYNENLKVIDVEENKVKKVSPDAFKGLKRIQVLRLNFNQIEHWDAGLLRDVEAIHSLELIGNKIRCPEGDFEMIFKANITNLGFNPLDSDCKKNIQDWNKVHGSDGKKVCIKPDCN